MNWFFLLISIALEVAGTIAAKRSNGFTEPVASIIMICLYILSFSSLTIAMKNLDMSIAYPIWTGCSIVIVSILGIILLHEPIDSTKSFSLFFLALGLIGLSASSQSHN